MFVAKKPSIRFRGKFLIIIASICLLLVACGGDDFYVGEPRFSASGSLWGIEKPVHPGENRGFGIDVTNAGNRPITMFVEAKLTRSNENEIVLESKPLFELQPNERVRIKWNNTFIQSGDWTITWSLRSPEQPSHRSPEQPDINIEPQQGIIKVEPCKGLDVYRVWKAGHNTGECALWGKSMLWWGRIGKLVTLLSALAIIAEFLGPTRRRNVGQKFHGAINVRRLLGSILPAYLWAFWTTVNWVTTILLFWLPRARPVRARATEKSLQHLADAGALGRLWQISIAVICLLALGLALLIANEFSIGFLGILLIFSIFMVSLGAILILAAPITWVVVLSVTNALLREPFAGLMERGDRRVKIASFTVFLIGFHFDLLAS